MNRVPARMAALVVLAAFAAVAPARSPKPPPTGALLLDMSDPVIVLTVGGVPLRLRVGLEAKRLIELNPAALARVQAAPPARGLRFAPGAEAQVGRKTLQGVEAAAPIEINGRKMIVTLASHGRDCCAGADGEIGVGLLPYAVIRFVRAGIANPGQSRDFAMADDDETGLQATASVGRGTISLQFSLDRAESVATSSAGATLARVHGGRLTESMPTIAAFGVARPTALLSFPRPVDIAGFRFERLRVRTADFAGKLAFPADPTEAEEIVVQKRIEQQRAWPVVLIGRDRLDRCSELSFDSIAHRLTLHCAFDGIS